jgi:ubiquinol-cytochrome c reductase cytochrome c1 subunit
MKYFWLALCLLFCSHVFASGEQIPLDKANIDPSDTESLRRGARLFANYCFGCHSASMMRYKRIGKDLGLDDAQLESSMIFTGAKVGDLMKNAMNPEDAKRWFGVTPPDLTVVSRSRGVDWIYTYLRSFYKDDSRPWGVNNAVFKDVAMPHVLWELQGLQVPQYDVVTNEEGVKRDIITRLDLAEPGKMSKEEYDNTVRDIVNFLNYMGEPTKPTRLKMGKWVLLYLAIFLVVVFLLKKEYWKDVSRNS